MAKVSWRAVKDKLDELILRVPPEYGEGLSGLARYAVEAPLRGEIGITSENFRIELTKARKSAEEDGTGSATIARVHVHRLMDAFAIERDNYNWFLHDEGPGFSARMRALDQARTGRKLDKASSLKLLSKHPRKIWTKELLSDIGSTQGDELGLVVSFSGRPLLHETSNWGYGFSRISVTIDLRGSPSMRFEVNEQTRAGYEMSGFKFRSRGVSTRPEFEVATIDQSAIDDRFISDTTGILKGALNGDKLIARTRVERREGVIVYLGDTPPPSKTKQEIIAQIFALTLPDGERGPLQQFATLCEQEIIVVEETDERPGND